MNNELSKDEQLVNQFFSEYSKQEIPDNGFSARVMEQIEAVSAEAPLLNTAPSGMGSIPSSFGKKLGRGFQVWRNLPTLLCAVACIVLFIAVDGVTVLSTALLNTLKPLWVTFCHTTLHALNTSLIISHPSSLIPHLLYIYIAILTIIIVAAYNIVLIEKRRNFTF